MMLPLHLSQEQWMKICFFGKIRSSRNTRQTALIDEEKNLCILKIKEAIEQQRQLHKIKMQAAKAELFSSLAAAKKAAKELSSEEVEDINKLVDL
jgi:hypothetical protein